MPAAANLTGRRFGRLVARRPTGRRVHGSVVWECDCDCGSAGVPVVARSLVRGMTQSCGCLQREAVAGLHSVERVVACRTCGRPVATRQANQRYCSRRCRPSYGRPAAAPGVADVTLRSDIAAATAAIYADPPPLPGWPRAGRAVPSTSLVPELRRLGWPLVTAEAVVANPDPRRPPAAQQLTCVPAAWLRALADRLGWDWSRACRYEIPDE